MFFVFRFCVFKVLSLNHYDYFCLNKLLKFKIVLSLINYKIFLFKLFIKTTSVLLFLQKKQIFSFNSPIKNL